MKLVTLILSFLISTMALAVKPTAQTVLASIKMNADNSQYKILVKPNDKEALLERTSAKLSNKSVRIPKGLASDIKGDLLSLQWQAQYKSVRKAASGCEVVATVDIEAEDTVKICRDQLDAASRISSIQTHLNELINSKK